MIEIILRKLGLVRKSEVINNLNYCRSVAKRLDEHRELVESLEKVGFFEEYFWHIGHMATQDDYLIRLYFMANDHYPIEVDFDDLEVKRDYGYVRQRPEILGECNLPEYPKFIRSPTREGKGLQINKD